MLNILSWIFGAGGMLCLFLTYQQKKRGNLIKYKLCADVCWAVHYFCLGAYGGMIPNFLGIFRELVFAQRGKKKWANSTLIPIAFIAVNLGVGILTFQKPENILPIVASVFVTISLWLREPKLTMLISLPISFTFFVYDIFVGSFIGMANESVVMTSIIISLIKYFKQGDKNKMKNSIFTSNVATDKPEFIIEGVHIEAPAASLRVNEADSKVFLRGERFSQEIAERFVADFEKKEVDKMAHVSTFKLIDGIIYMSYYANTATSNEDPLQQTARFAYCPAEDVEKMTILDVQTVGDELSGERINMVYDTIFAQSDDNTLYILWTAKAGETYYRFYRPFYLDTKSFGEIGVNRLKIGDVVNDFSNTGIVDALRANGLGHKKMYSDIGIMQKFTERVENGVKYYYTGAYSGDLNMIIKSRDFITWEYVSEPSFPNASKWENATYVIGDKIYYFVRQQDDCRDGFLTMYDISNDTWETPVLIDDCQSRSDFIEYGGELYLFHAPTDREHIGIVRIDKENIANSEFVLVADIHSSCFYPFIQYFKNNELAMSYTVNRQHIRLAEFTLSKYLD